MHLAAILSTVVSCLKAIVASNAASAIILQDRGLIQATPGGPSHLGDIVSATGPGASRISVARLRGMIRTLVGTAAPVVIALPSPSAIVIGAPTAAAVIAAASLTAAVAATAIITAMPAIVGSASTTLASTIASATAIITAAPPVAVSTMATTVIPPSCHGR